MPAKSVTNIHKILIVDIMELPGAVTHGAGAPGNKTRARQVVQYELPSTTNIPGAFWGLNLAYTLLPGELRLGGGDGGDASLGKQSILECMRCNLIRMLYLDIK